MRTKPAGCARRSARPSRSTASTCASRRAAIVGLIGPNGAGKTTALNAILGLTPYEGELRVLGRDPGASATR